MGSAHLITPRSQSKRKRTNYRFVRNRGLHLASCRGNRRQRLSSFFTERSHSCSNCSMHALFLPDLPQVRHSMHPFSVTLDNTDHCKRESLQNNTVLNSPKEVDQRSICLEAIKQFHGPSFECTVAAYKHVQTCKILGLFGIGILLTGFWFPRRMNQLR